MERCAASAGGGVVAIRFPATKYQAPPAITMSATIPAISGVSAQRFFGSAGLASVAGFAWAGTPTCSE
jgi:hypothetical protein